MTPLELFDLSGQAAIVTGSTKGIGLAIAWTLAQAGAKVVISSRDAANCAKVAAEINAAGFEAAAIPCNISHIDQLESLVGQTMDRFGRIDILIANAAINPHFGALAGIGEDVYDKTMNTNVKNNLWLCNMVAPRMADLGGGAIVIVSSVAGFKGNARIGLYGLSKAADFQLARILAAEWGARNVRVNCLAPGLVKTDFARALWDNPEIHDRILAGIPLKRLATPEDIAGGALFLASRAGSYITGEIITIDGGAQATNAGY